MRLEADVHVCHAKGCGTPIPSRLLMCRPHWALVPPPLKRRVLEAFTPGQERGQVRPSQEWTQAAMAAIKAVALTERHQAEQTAVPVSDEMPVEVWWP
ncbi:hypothetical protein [Candidatus Nitronereus thalassa]|uniref:Uncharacterized protein n=1 Tax=Candidatus Nitronereus thalassa TaxID=3020898 RepID=A0ABU3K390_9BACT|nr:hypothetical protein [Candidatus Nitronereus thalassa]MDT7040841.1 hypothetical protein [Candidatus Nitronereus thalassa]